MSYSGVVVPGGPADTRDLAHLSITKVAVDLQMSNNAYLLRCRATGEQLLIDAAAEAPRLLDLVFAEGALATVVTTHQHWDHHRALAEVVAGTGAAALAGEPDADAITSQTGVAIGRGLLDGDVVVVGECELEVIGLRGHTPGSVALLYRDPSGHGHLFTGDSLFPGGVGGTFGTEQEKKALFEQLITDVETRIFDRLPDDTHFYPGHGNDSTIGAERPHLPEWRARGW
jgi:glyoxylase-like metal-dependent hydrolase (beta-lactamase superfamily II)